MQSKMNNIDKLIYSEKKQAMYEEECLADAGLLELRESEESIQDYYECMNDYLSGTMGI